MVRVVRERCACASSRALVRGNKRERGTKAGALKKMKENELSDSMVWFQDQLSIGVGIMGQDRKRVIEITHLNEESEHEHYRNEVRSLTLCRHGARG